MPRAGMCNVTSVGRWFGVGGTNIPTGLQAGLCTVVQTYSSWVVWGQAIHSSPRIISDFWTSEIISGAILASRVL